MARNGSPSGETVARNGACPICFFFSLRVAKGRLVKFSEAKKSKTCYKNTKNKTPKEMMGSSATLLLNSPRAQFTIVDNFWFCVVIASVPLFACLVRAHGKFPNSSVICGNETIGVVHKPTAMLQTRALVRISAVHQWPPRVQVRKNTRLFGRGEQTTSGTKQKHLF